jgi:hypothetical protein
VSIEVADFGLSQLRRHGAVYLYVEGDPTKQPACSYPGGSPTAAREILLRPGEQYTIPPATLHWFQAGREGAVVSEFSSTSRDGIDEFSNPAIHRETALGRVSARSPDAALRPSVRGTRIGPTRSAGPTGC